MENFGFKFLFQHIKCSYSLLPFELYLVILNYLFHYSLAYLIFLIIGKLLTIWWCIYLILCLKERKLLRNDFSFCQRKKTVKYMLELSLLTYFNIIHLKQHHPILIKFGFETRHVYFLMFEMLFVIWNFHLMFVPRTMNYIFQNNTGTTMT
jgi:hypothetical protein